MKAEQKQCKKTNKSLDSLAAVDHKNKRNAAGNSEKLVQPWIYAILLFSRNIVHERTSVIATGKLGQHPAQNSYASRNMINKTDL